MQAPQTTIDDEDTLAREYIQQLQTGIFPDLRPDSFGNWDSIVVSLEMVLLKSRHNGEAVTQALEAFCKNDKALVELLNPPPRIEDIQLPDEDAFPPLPDAVQFDPKLAASACPWLDEYIAFSKYWSPRGHEKFHEPIGIALLSAVAGRRVSFQFGPQKQFTNFYIALLGDSTFYRKSTTARIYQNVLSAAKLDWLFGADVTTPQKLLSDMAGRHVPPNYGEMDAEEQETLKKRLAMSGQLGWFYDEFGMHMDAMVKENGIMSDFKGLLRRLDDSNDKFANGTLSRNVERIEKPYLSLLASMTPSDIKPYAQKENKFWRDGLFARFCWVCPPVGAKFSRARFPNFGKTPIYPGKLIDPLKAWSDELDYPVIDIVPQTNKSGTDVTGWAIEKIKELPEQICVAVDGIEDALYRYENALIDMIETGKVPVALYANYGRMHILALRVAMLLASFDNHGHIELRHWARGQQFAEDRRHDLHELFIQTNADEYVSQAAKLEDKILRRMQLLKTSGIDGVTIAVLHGHWLKSISTKELKGAMDAMADENILRKEVTKSAKYGKYFIV